MAFEIPLFDVSLVAGADLSASQYKAVKVDNTGKAVLCSAVGDPAVGILQNNPKAGQTAQVRIFGVTMAVAGAAVTVGSIVGTDANGKVVAATEATANTTDGTISGSRAVGIALESASAADQVISIALLHMGLV